MRLTAMKRGSRFYAELSGGIQNGLYPFPRSFGEAMRRLLEESQGRGELDVGSIACKSSKSPVKGQALKTLCVLAWHEVFGIEPPPTDANGSLRNRRRELLAYLEDGVKGVRKWNKEHGSAQVLAPFRKAKLEGRQLTGIRLVDMPGADFSSSDLSKANGRHRNFRKSVFKDATLEKARLDGANLKFCDFTNANLTGANLKGAQLQGAVLTGANLEGVNFRNTQCDEETQWPVGHAPSTELRWLGDGVDPAALAVIAAEKKASGPIDLAAFMKRVEGSVDKKRLDKALKMLKQDSFQLFVDVAGDSLTGVVKSQTDPDLVYSCRLEESGAFACCTQNLNPCGGLRGALCKHLLVLSLGMAQAGEIDPDLLDDWVQRSRLQTPKLDKDAMGAVLLKYKGAEAGELDWRPTETVPEDFYAY